MSGLIREEYVYNLICLIHNLEGWVIKLQRRTPNIETCYSRLKTASHNFCRFHSCPKAIPPWSLLQWKIILHLLHVCFSRTVTQCGLDRPRHFVCFVYIIYFYHQRLTIEWNSSESQSMKLAKHMCKWHIQINLISVFVAIIKCSCFEINKSFATWVGI